MNVPIPPEFEAFAREQVAAGRYASEAEVVADALQQYLADREALLALLDPAIEQLDRGEGRPFDPRIPSGVVVSDVSARAHAQDNRLAARSSRHRRNLGSHRARQRP